MSGVSRLLRGENNIDFVAWWKRGLVLSVVLLVVSVGALAVRGLNLTVEFTGGVSVEAPVEGVSADEARQALSDAGQPTARVQVVTDVTGNEVLRVQTAEQDTEGQDELLAAIAGLAGVDRSEVSVTAVTASWGADVTRQALRALVFFLAAILVYLTLRLEFRMAVGAIVATVHDIVIVLGIYAIFRFEVSPATVIAFLMVLGYSLYDTVVVYDKIKGGEPLVGVANRMTYTEGAVRSTNLVLLRSVHTSISSLLPVLSLIVVGAWLLGATTLNQFAIALALGLVVGTYSSIMVAVPVVVWLKEREPRYRQLRERLAAGAGTPPGASGTGPVTSGAPGATPAPTPPGGNTPGGTGKGGKDRPDGGVRRTEPAGPIPPRPRKRSGPRNRRR